MNDDHRKIPPIKGKPEIRKQYLNNKKKLVTASKFKTVSLDTIVDKHIGKRGSERRDAFENELRIDLLGLAIKHAILEKNLRQGIKIKKP